MPKPIQDARLPELSIFYGDLVGGLDMNSSPTALPPGKSQNLSNFSLQEAGALMSQEGWEQFTATPLTPAGDDVLQGGSRVYLATPLTLVAYNGGIYSVDSGGTFSSVLDATRNASNQIYFPYNGEVCLVVDGANRPLITVDGVTFYDVGIAAPVSDPTLSLTAGGSLIDTDEYEVSYTFGSASVAPDLVHESNESGTAVITAATPNRTIQVQGYGSDDPKVDTIYIYAKNNTTGMPVARQVASLANTDSSTQWTKTFALEPNEVALAPPTDADLPEAFSFAFFWKNRWWAFHPTIKNRLQFSQVFQPQTWPVDFYVDLPMTLGDELASLEALGDVLALFGKTGIYLLTAPTTLELDVLPALSFETGAFGPRAVQRVESGIVHGGTAGAFLFNGASDVDISKDIRPGWRDMVQNCTSAQLNKVALTYLPRLSQLFIAVPRMFPTGSPGEYVLDFLRMNARKSEAWAKTDRDILGYLPQFGNEPVNAEYGRLFSWPTLTGILNEERVGFTADGSDMTAIFSTAAQTTQFRETALVNGFIEYQPADGNLTVDLYVNGNKVNSQVFPLNASLAVYGTAEYGVAVYGGSGRRKLALWFPLPADGTEFYLDLTYVGSSRFKIFSYGFGTVPEPVIRTL